MAWQYHLAGWKRMFDADEGADLWVPDIPEVGAYGVIDLRPSKARSGPDGLCLVATPEDASGFNAAAVKFGHAPDDVIPASVIRSLGRRLGVSLIATSTKEMIYELLTAHADDADRNKWDRLKPTAGRKRDNWRRYEEIYLGELIDRRLHSVRQPGRNTIIINDQFTHVAANEVLENEAPDTVNTPGNNWDNIQNTLEGDGSNNIRWDTANSNAQMAQINAGDSDAKVLTEFKTNHASNTDTGYAVARNVDMATNQNQAASQCIRFQMSGTPEGRILRKDDPGGATILASDTGLSYSANTFYVLGGAV